MAQVPLPSEETQVLKDMVCRLKQQLAQTQSALEACEQRFLMAEDSARIGVWDYDVLTDTTYLSPGWCSMMGIPLEKAPRDWADWEKILHPEDRERSRHAYERILRDPNAPYEQEFRLRHTSGRYLWVLSRAKAMVDAEGKAVRLVGVHIDITNIKEIHQQMQEREKTLEELSKVMSQKIGIADRTGRLIFVSDAWIQYSGMNLAETAIGNSWLQIVHPEDRPRMVERWKRMILGTIGPDIEVRLQRHTDGLYRWHRMQHRPMRTQDGVVERWYLVATDVHDQRRLEFELRSSSKSFQKIFSSRALGVFLAEGATVIEANDAFLTLVGAAIEEVQLGKLRYPTLSEAEIPIDALQWTESSYTRPDGSSIPVLVNYLRSGEQVLGLAIDLSQRKQAEESLRSKLNELRAANEDLEHLAHIACHDLREPAHTLSLYLDLLSEQRNALEQNAEDMLDYATQACRRLVQQIDNLHKHQPTLNNPHVSASHG